MGNEVFPLAKGFPTFSTIIKRSATVKSLMCKETGLVGKIFSTMAAFKRPFPSVNFLVLSNTISLGAGIPNFVGLTRLFSSENSLILNKYVCVAASHLAFSPVLIAFVTVKNSFTLLTVVQFLPRITGLWLNHVKPYHVGLEVIHNLHVGREIPCCMDCPAFQKWGSHHIILKGFLSNVLLLVLLNVCRKIEFFPTCPTWVGFLCPICSFLFSQMQNVSQDWDTYLTGLGLFRGQNGPWGPNLWDSFCRFALFRRCLFILDSTPRTWNKQVMVKFWLTFLKGMKGSLWLFATPWTVTYQATLTMGFSRQDCWSALPFPSPGDLPDPGIEPRSPALQADALPSEPPGKPWREWHHHTCTSATWKKQSIQSCSGHEIAIKLRKHLFSSSTGHKD